ncbi:MAG: glycogen synthase, partial [Flavobacteriaceae bacterium]|nr:glycogen synthase [Flavobacteriaceae bacterium]
DTVVDFEEKNGYGIRFLYYSIEDILFSINRAEKIFMDKNAFNTYRKRMMEINFSWENQAKKYIQLYQELN